MKFFTNRSLMGILLGWTITFEGFFALSISNSATIDGIGQIMSSTFALAAIQLTVLGIIITIFWALNSVLPKFEKSIWGKLINIIAFIGMAIVALEGLIVLNMAGDVMVAGFGGVTKKIIVLVGAQLFAIGVLSLRLWRLRNVRPTNWLVDVMGSLIAALLMAEGLIATGIASNVRIEGIGTVLERTVQLAGLQLFLLGTSSFILWTVVYDPSICSRIKKILSERLTFLIAITLGAIVAIEGVVAAMMAAPVVFDEVGGVRKLFVVAGCVQLFILGLAVPVLWKLRQRPMAKKFLPELICPLALVLLASEGVAAIGLAAIVQIDGIGGVMERTFLLAGWQLLILSMMSLVVFLVKDGNLNGSWIKRTASFIPVIVLGTIGLEGVIATMLSANIMIDGIGSVREQYVLFGGLQMGILAIMALISWAMSEGFTTRLKAISTGTAAFVALLLPIAFLL
jgi:hypothetical protein